MGLVSICMGTFTSAPTYGAVIWSGRLFGIGSAIVAGEENEICWIGTSYCWRCGREEEEKKRRGGDGQEG